MKSRKTDKAVEVTLDLSKLEVEEFDWETSTWKKVSRKELEKLPRKSVTVY